MRTTAPILLVLLLSLCLYPTPRLYARQVSVGTISGTVTDPSGAVVANASVQTRTVTTTASRREARTDARGHFLITGLPAGKFQISVTRTGFQPKTLRAIIVQAGRPTALSITLSLAAVRTSITVSNTAQDNAARLSLSAADRNGAPSSAALLAGIPGLSLRGSGLLASVPLLHGMGDERVRIVINGATVSNACPQHMNPPLSYIAPAAVSKATIIAGITPVSMGGDSLAGTIAVDSPDPVFAAPGERLFHQGSASGFFRSNGQNFGGSASEWLAGRHLGIGYAASWSEAGDYTDGSGNTITSTYAQTTDHTITLAAQDRGNLVVLRAGLHHIPYQGFVNQRMDMVRNYGTSLNFEYRRTFSDALLDTHIYWQGSSHDMNNGHDKSAISGAMPMPMNDHGTDLGYSIKLEIPLSSKHLLRAGNELHHFVLNDTWAAVPMTAPMTGPDSFLNINNGRRVRVGTYAELASKWSPCWSTLVGARNDTVWTNAGPVHGYSSMYDMDSDQFNAANRARTNADADATILVQYHPAARAALDFGYARKSRAPNLYERYTWSTNLTAATMIGWFGDGNAYVGNLNLKPEIAHTFAATLNLRGSGAARTASWHLQAAPYLTHVQDYIDVNTLSVTPQGMSNLALLQFANHNARIYGAAISGDTGLWKTATLTAVGNYLQGTRLDTDTPLYQMMPPNLRLDLNEAFPGHMRGLVITAGMAAVNRKSRVDPHRFEPPTPGYTLFHFHAAYRRGPLNFSAGIDNLLNKEYALPLGGVNLDRFMAAMAASTSSGMGSGMGSSMASGMGSGMAAPTLQPVTAPGRSASVAVTVRF